MTDGVIDPAERDPSVRPMSTVDLLSPLERRYARIVGETDLSKLVGVSERTLWIAIGNGQIGMDNTEIGSTITEADIEGEQ